MVGVEQKFINGGLEQSTFWSSIGNNRATKIEVENMEIKRAEYIGGYSIRLYFSNGQIRLADLESSLCGPIFQPLKDIDYFKQFSIPYNTIQWENGADFAPEYLYGISTPE